jgi:PAS domain S-box-containing protein
VTTSSSADEAATQTMGQELLETFLTLVPDAAIIVDGEGVIVSANEQAAALFGYPPGALVGERVELLVPERFRHRHREHRLAYAQHPRARAMVAG